MARIAGVDLPRDKRVEYGLTYIYGIGLPTSQKILKTTGINPDIRVKAPNGYPAFSTSEWAGCVYWPSSLFPRITCRRIWLAAGRRHYLHHRRRHLRAESSPF